MANKKITQLTEVTVVTSDDVLPIVTNTSTTAVTKKIKPSNLFSGWIASHATWSYSSADAPTFVISINADMTGILGKGMRIQITQSSVNYFIITAVGVYSGGATLVTVYGGTDYTLANATITSAYYSQAKAPINFPMARTKWDIVVPVTTAYVKTSPTTNTWYGQTNLMDSSLALPSINVPIGDWEIGWEYLFYGAASAAMAVELTLSTSASTESDKELSNIVAIGVNPAFLYAPASRSKNITVTSKTPYYTLLRSITSASSIGIDNGVTNTIRLKFGYL